MEYVFTQHTFMVRQMGVVIINDRAGCGLHNMGIVYMCIVHVY